MSDINKLIATIFEFDYNPNNQTAQHPMSSNIGSVHKLQAPQSMKFGPNIAQNPVAHDATSAVKNTTVGGAVDSAVHHGGQALKSAAQHVANFAGEHGGVAAGLAGAGAAYLGSKLLRRRQM